MARQRHVPGEQGSFDGDTETTDCARCLGTGVVVSGPGAVIPPGTCAKCGGTGKVTRLRAVDARQVRVRVDLTLDEARALLSDPVSAEAQVARAKLRAALSRAEDRAA